MDEICFDLSELGKFVHLLVKYLVTILDKEGSGSFMLHDLVYWCLKIVHRSLLKFSKEREYYFLASVVIKTS